MESVLFTIGGSVINALAFISINFCLRKLTDNGEKEHKRLEKLQRTREKQNEDRMKRLNFINKRLLEKKMKQ